MITKNGGRFESKKKLILEPPPLGELKYIIQSGLGTAFREISVDIRMGPDLRQSSFHLAGLVGFACS